MAKLKALQTLALESKRVRHGDTFSVKDPEQAAVLIAGGLAEEVAKPTATAPAAAEKEEKKGDLRETKELKPAATDATKEAK